MEGATLETTLNKCPDLRSRFATSTCRIRIKIGTDRTGKNSPWALEMLEALLVLAEYLGLAQLHWIRA